MSHDLCSAVSDSEVGRRGEPASATRSLTESRVTAAPARAGDSESRRAADGHRLRVRLTGTQAGSLVPARGRGAGGGAASESD